MIYILWSVVWNQAKNKRV